MELVGNLPQKWQANGIVNQAQADWADVLFAGALALAPLFFLTVRSWTNGFLFALFTLAVLDISRRPQQYRMLLADRHVRWMLAALVSGLLAVFFSQALRGDFIFKVYDAPLRLLLAVPVFLTVAARRVDFLRLFQWICPFSVFVTAILVLADHSPREHWSGRWATYFVDPLTLGQYTLLFAFFCLFSIDFYGKEKLWARAYKFAGFLVGFGVSVGTQARSAWLALPFMVAIWLLVVLRIKKPVKFVAGLVILTVVCLALYELVPAVHERVHRALIEAQMYFGGRDRDTSTGLRISLWRASWHLFLASPLYGYGDAQVPPLQNFPAIVPYYTPMLEIVINRNGTHSELMQNAIRSGIFGVVSFFLLFAVPAAIYARALRAKNPQATAAAAFGLCGLVAVFCFGLNTELFSLKYLASFYGLMIAQTAGLAIWAAPAAGRTRHAR